MGWGGERGRRRVFERGIAPTRHRQTYTHHTLHKTQQEYSHLLGMGPQLARADLAIRGAGEVLGYEQSGDKGGDEIGYEAYMEMLAEALVKGASWVDV